MYLWRASLSSEITRFLPPYLRLGLPNCLFRSYFATNILCVRLISSTRPPWFSHFSFHSYRFYHQHCIFIDDVSTISMLQIVLEQVSVLCGVKKLFVLVVSLTNSLTRFVCYIASFHSVSTFTRSVMDKVGWLWGILPVLLFSSYFYFLHYVSYLFNLLIFFLYPFLFKRSIVHLNYGLARFTQALADDLKERYNLPETTPTTVSAVRGLRMGKHETSTHVHVIYCRRLPWEHIVTSLNLTIYEIWIGNLRTLQFTTARIKPFKCAVSSPLFGNGFQRIRMQRSRYCWTLKNGNGVFYVVRAEMLISRVSRVPELIIVSWENWQEFCGGVCDKRTWAREAEESPFLEAIARERLFKTQQAGKGIADPVVICKVWRLAMGL
jgi:hypothetical protein